MKSKNFYHRIIAFFVLNIFFFVQIISVPITYASDKNFFASIFGNFKFDFFSDSKIEYQDIVAVLVPKKLYENDTDLIGLRDNESYRKYLSAKNIKQRIDRYAQEIQKNLPQTKALIIQIEEGQQPSDISKILETLYFEGEKTDDSFASLAGIVLIGNFPTQEDKSLSIALPIVNKNGNSFLSMYPYTDFDDKTYVYNSESDNFEFVGSEELSKPEIWHGVIVPPTGSDEGLELLSEFFDKNYLYHTDVEDFSKFDKKIFYHDQFRIEENTNNFLFKNYLNYTDFWEQMGFMQYTKQLVKELQERRGTVFENFDGLDNDRDGQTDEEAENGEDDDGDGLIDEDIGSSNQLDDDFDGKLNEDGPEIEFDDRDKDNALDEDKYGDMNADGCTGTCKIDDDSDCQDIDGDDLPVFLEKEYGWDPMRKWSPFPLAKISIRDWEKSECIDEEPSRGDPNCFDSAGAFHKEWDDDEDGLCDEDTGEINPKTGFHDNDNDLDGLVNEDPGNVNEEEENPIDSLPDIYSKKIAEKFFSKYYEIYTKLLGNINDLIAYTGRYDVNYVNEDGFRKSDYDNIINLITKKDETVLNFLTSVNFKIEKEIDSATKNDLQEDIPLFHKALLKGKLKSENGNKNFEVEFVNHGVEDKDKHTFAHPYILGRLMKSVTSASQCSLFLGDINEGTNAKLIEANRVYNPETYEPYKKDLNDDGYKGRDYAGCNATFYEYPQYCFPEASVAPIFDKTNGRKIEKKTSTEYEPSYISCFDFKYGPNFWGENESSNADYLTFIDKIVKEIDKLLNSEQDENYDQDDLEEDINEIVYEEGVNNNRYTTKYTTFNRAYLHFGDKKAPIKELLIGLGFDPDNYSEIQEKFFAFGKTHYEIGEKVFKEYSSAIIDVTRYYAEKDSDGFTDDISKAKTIPSIVYHKEPTASTISKQLKQGIATDLPIDNPRYLSFRSKADKYTEIMYPNLFQYENFENFKAALEDTQLEIAKLPGGSSYSTFLIDIFDEDLETKINDAIKWQNMNIDEKYAYAFNTYLSSKTENESFDANKIANGYEIFYLNASGTATAFNYRANGDIPPDENDLVFPDPEEYFFGKHNSAPPPPNNDQTTDYNNPEQDSFSIEDAISLLEWLPALLDWMDELDESVFGSEAQSYCGLESAKEPISNEPVTYEDMQDDDGNGIPNAAEDTKFLSVKIDKDLLRADNNDSAKVIVTAKKNPAKKSAKNTKDSFTEIELFIEDQNNGFQVLSQNPITMLSGQANFTIASTFNPSEGQIYARATKREDINSNKENIESTKDRLKLTVYKKGTETGENIILQKEETQSLIIRDLDKLVAELYLTNGEIKISDIDYELIANPYYEGHQTNIEIKKRSDQSSIAKITHSLSAASIITDEALTTEELKKNDYILFKSKNLITKKQNDGIDIFDINNLIIGSIKNNGNISIIPELNLSIKENNIFKWQILNKASEILGEIEFFPKDKTKFEIKNSDNKNLDLSGFNLNFKKIIIPIANAATHYATDSDSDGLKNLEEKILHTDFEKQDTDLDNFADENELLNGYDPSRQNKLLFIDLDLFHEAFDSVIKLLRRGVITGYKIRSSDGEEENAYLPEQEISREQMVKLSLALQCINCTNFSEKIKKEINKIYSESPFPDKDISYELNYCTEFAKNENIVSGYKSGDFKDYFLPQNKITRAEAIKIILEASDTEVINTEIKTGMPWYYNYVLTAKRYQIYPEGRFKELDYYDLQSFEIWFDKELEENGDFVQWLSGNMTRGEFAIMIVKTLEQIFDCESIDSDQDGLSDNTEIYQYGTDPNKPDTDFDTVIDGEEIFHDTDPLKADLDEAVATNDDNTAIDSDSDGDGLSDTYEQDIASDPLDADSDNDGLSDGTEVGNNTSPTNPDSDLDGNTDAEELLNGITSNENTDNSDSILADDSGSGMTINTLSSGTTVTEESLYSESQTTETIENDTVIYTNQIAANGISKLYALASIIKSDGTINSADNNSIIEFKLATDEFGTIEKRKIKVKAGQAQTVFASTTTAGITDVSAQILQGERLPIEEKEIFVYPGQPASIDIIPNSMVIPSGGEATIDGQIIIYDQFGNTANNGLQILTLSVEGEGTLINTIDENEEKEGTQISTLDGTVNFSIQSGKYEGAINIKANIDDLSEIFAIESKSGLIFNVKSDKTYIQAGNTENIALINIEVLDNITGNLIKGLNINYNIKLADESLGKLNINNLKIENGIAENQLTPLNVADKATIMVTSAGIESGSTDIEILPSSPYKIVLSSDKKTLTKNDSATLTAKLFDEYGNFVYTDDETKINFRITKDTSRFGEIKDLTVIVKNGIAETQISPTNTSGPINILAEQIDENLIAGTTSIQSLYSIDYNFVKNSEPNALFASLLGFEAGNLTYENNLASSFAFSGKVEAVLSTTTDTEKSLRIGAIKANGQIDLIDENYGYLSFVASKDLFSAFAVQFTDPLEKKALAKIYYLINNKELEIIKTYQNEDQLINDGKIQIAVSDNLSDYSLSYTEKETKIKQNKFSEDKIKSKIITLNKNGKTLMTITEKAAIQLLDKNIDLTFVNNKDSITFDITENNQKIGQILIPINQDKNVKILKTEESIETLSEEGIYIEQSKNAEFIGFEKANFGQSSLNGYGYFIIDKEVDISKKQKPGSSYQSLESAKEKTGIGFHGDNKHLLLFASGINLGKATQPYLSDIGILIGDPLIKLPFDESLVASHGFDKGLGQLIDSTNKNIKKIIAPFDYDNDANEDLLLVFEDGTIKLIQNQGSNKIKSKGDILFVSNRIRAIDKGDFNKDGFTDLIISTETSCLSNEVSCSYIYWNKEGVFEREYLPLDIKGRINEIHTTDLNNDSYIDFVISDELANVIAFYNKNGSFKEAKVKTTNTRNNPFAKFDKEDLIDGQSITNLGLKIDSTENLFSELIVEFDNMPTNNTLNTSDDINFYKFPFGSETRELTYIDTISDLASSTKYGYDLNEGTLEANDIVKYKIEIKNSGQNNLTHLNYIDIVPYSMEYIDNSIVCITCTEKGPTITKTASQTRPFIIADINLNQGQNIIFEYQTQVKKEDTIPKVKILVTKLNDDNYPDMMLTTESNPTGQLIKISSQSKSKEGRINYIQKLSEPNLPANPVEDIDADLPVTIPPDNNGNLIPDTYETMTEAPEDVSNYRKNQTEGDNDEDGLPNEWDNLVGNSEDIFESVKAFNGENYKNEALNKLAGGLDTLMSLLSCSGGCLALPINISLLTPGTIQILGIPIMPDPIVWPIFGATVNPPFVCSGPTCFSPGPFRVYVSPTTTGGLGASVCIGPFPVGQCFSSAVPIWELLKMAGVPDFCAKINGAIEGALSKANEFIQSANGTIAISLNGKSSSSSISEARSQSGGVSSYNLGNYKVPANLKANISIPGFPGIITDWWARQTKEFTTLLDLPDITFIYPDIGGLLGQTKTASKDLANAFNKKITGPADILTALNKMPLLQIKTQDIVIKLPTLSPEEITRLVTESKLWIQDLQDDFDRVSQNWSKETKASWEKEIGEVIASVQQNIDTLEAYGELPLQILALKDEVLYYVYQILCYIEAIVDFTIGYVETNAQRAGTWIALIRNATKAIKTWQAFLNLSVDYQKGCDKCTTQRFTLYQLIAQLFVFLPELPILDLPKWPDIIVDMSHIQAGLTIYWPEISFDAQSITIPPLPQIKLPTIPGLEIDLPAMELLPPPPDLSIDLPELPPLSFPKLPNLPPAPKFPKLPNELTVAIGIIGKLIRILCIIKSGFVPTPEFNLKTTIEDLTARPLSPVLPIDLSLGIEDVEGKKIDWYELIKVDGYTNLNVDSKFIIDTSSKVAETFNEFSEEATEYVSTGLEESFSKIQDKIDEVVDAAEKKIKEAEEKANEKLDLDDSNDDTQSYQFENKDIQNLLTILQNINSKTSNYYKESREFEKAIYLSAENQNIDINELTKKYTLDEIKKRKIANINNISPYIDLREKLLTYMKEENEVNSRLYASRENNNFYKLLVKNTNDFLLAKNSNNNEIIFDNRDIDIETSQKSPMTPAFNQLQSVIENLADLQSQLIADESTSDASSNNNSSPAILEKGIFIFNSEKQINENLMNYSAESEKESQFVFLDMDKDSDEDIIYTLGNDIYFKENFTKNSQKQYITRSPKASSSSDMAVKYNSINHLNNFTNSDQAVNFNFLYESKLKTIYGYLATIKKSRTHFDINEKKTASRKLFIIPNSNFDEIKLEDFTDIALAKYKILDGDIAITKSSTSDEEYVSTGDLIESSDTAEIELSFADGSTAIIEGIINLEIPALGQDSLKLILKSGDMQLNLVDDSKVFKISSSFATKENAHLIINFADKIITELQTNQQTKWPTLSNPDIIISNVDGNINLTSFANKTLKSGKETFNAARLIHAIEDSNFEINELDENGEIIENLNPIYKLSANQVLEVESGNFGSQIEITDGEIELIDKSTITELEAKKGMMLFKGISILSTKNSEADLQFKDGPKFHINKNEIIEFMELSSTKNTNIEYTLENGTFFLELKSFDKEGYLSSPGNKILLSPQICADETLPTATLGITELQLPIFKSTTLDASASFDPSSEISLYGWDLDTKNDKNGDGDSTNDFAILGKDQNIIQIGPYEDLETKNIGLSVYDRAGNKSSADLEISLYVPDITISTATETSGMIEGEFSPAESDMPFVLLRDRDGVYDFIETASIDEKKRYYSNINGKFEITDLNNENQYLIKNTEGEIIATLDPSGPRIVIDEDYNSTYITDIFPADNNSPTRLSVLTQNAEIIFSSIIVPDINTDVRIVNKDFSITKENVMDLNGIYIRNIKDSLTYNTLPGDDSVYPGGLEILDKEKKRIILIAANGNIYLLSDNLDLAPTKADNIEDPLIIEIQDTSKNNEVIAEVYIATEGEEKIESLLIEDTDIDLAEEENKKDSDSDGIPDSSELIYQLNPLDAKDANEDKDLDTISNLEEYKSGTNPNNADSDADKIRDDKDPQPLKKEISPFDDIDPENPLYDTIKTLFENNVLFGQQEGEAFNLKLEEKISRAEFTRIMNGMLCVEPRPEAYLAPQVFNDVNLKNSEQWEYAHTKESFLQGFITGYLDTLDEKTGLTDFKPHATINIAEQTKIILEVLNKFITLYGKTIIDLEEITQSEPWYTNWLSMAIKNSILTEKEAKDPKLELTRGKFIEIADRVFDMYNCYEYDSDNDGIPNQNEANYKTDPNNADSDSDGVTDGAEIKNLSDPLESNTDEDNDGLTNAEEVAAGTDPYSTDSDSGGVSDYDEITTENTDPNNSFDDDYDKDGLSNPEENKYSTDPNKADTDLGGVSDYQEVLRGTDPLNKEDDNKITANGLTASDAFLNNLDQGIYGIAAECLSCPCQSALENTADMTAGDFVYAAITDSANKVIFKLSNTVKILLAP